MALSIPTRTVKHKQGAQHTIQCCDHSDAKQVVVTAQLKEAPSYQSQSRWLLPLDGVLAGVWNDAYETPGNVRVSVPLVRLQRSRAWVWAGSAAYSETPTTIVWRAAGDPTMIREWLSTIRCLARWVPEVVQWDVETVAEHTSWSDTMCWIWEHPAARPIPVKLAMDAGIEVRTVAMSAHRPPYVARQGNENLVWVAVPPQLR